MYYQPTPITWNNHNFLVMSAPDNSTMKKCIQVRKHTIKFYLFTLYIFQDLKSFNVKRLARCCELTYDVGDIEQAGIEVNEFQFHDG